MPRTFVSAALIVRDEARHLEACLRTIVGHVDEIVVVDTGSSDDTREVAVAAGARLVERTWTDDFAAARNASIDAARGNWILYIDADERVVAFDRDLLDPQLADPRNVGLTVQFRPITGYTRYREHRLFRNLPDIRFRGAIHENIVPALEARCRHDGMRIAASEVRIDHLGYDGDMQRKHRRNLPLLQARVATDPDHIYSWAHLGETLLGLGDAEAAEQAWRSGVEAVRRRPRRTVADSLPHLHLVTLLLDQKRDPDALLREGTDWFPDNHSLTWQQARRLLECGRCDEAMPLFARLAEVDPERPGDGPIAFNATIFGANAHAAMGLCAFRLGRYEESAACYARAQALAPGDAGIAMRRTLAQARAAAGAVAR